MTTSHIKTEMVHITDIAPGDRIIHNGLEKTISQQNIKRCPFMGTSIYGDTYNGGRVLVERVLFPNWYKGKIVSYVAQI